MNKDTATTLCIGLAGGAALMTFFDGGLTFLVSAGLGLGAGATYGALVGSTIPPDLEDHEAAWVKCQIAVAAALTALAVFLSPFIGLIGSVIAGAFHSYLVNRNAIPENAK